MKVLVSIDEVKKGDSGVDVYLVQEILCARNILKKGKKYTAGTITNDNIDMQFGGSTEIAVKEYQKRRGFAVNGIVDCKMWADMLGK